MCSVVTTRSRLLLFLLLLLMGARLLHPVLRQASTIFACPQRCRPLQTSAFLPHQALIQKAVPSYKNSSNSLVQGMATENKGKNIVVYVTVPNKETGTVSSYSANGEDVFSSVPWAFELLLLSAGKDLAHSIVNAKLAACVNQVPGIESTYWWEGKVETDSEVLLVIKTQESLLKDLTDHVIKNHKYEVPEVIALPIIGGNPAYLKWLEDSTKLDEVPTSS